LLSQWLAERIVIDVREKYGIEIEVACESLCEPAKDAVPMDKVSGASHAYYAPADITGEYYRCTDGKGCTTDPRNRPAPSI
jgi:hypothetical protein